MIQWDLFIQAFVLFWIIILLLSKEGRKHLLEAAKKIITSLTSKRFLVLMLATWFVFKDIKIDPNWLILAGFFIGIDTMQNNQVFTALADFLKNRKGGK